MALPRRPTRVLVVDDDPAIRDLLTLMLETAGYAVQTAAHGREALDRIRTEPPCLVLLDLQMPVLGGQDVLRALRKAGVPVPVVVMSPAPCAQTVAVRYGADGHVAKPFELDTLLQVVGRLCTGASRSAAAATMVDPIPDNVVRDGPDHHAASPMPVDLSGR